MRKLLIVALSTLLAVAVTGAADAAVTFTFDSGNQGWVIGDVATATASPTLSGVGWAGGQLVISDQSGETGVYAPTAVLGNQSAAYNGSISFDVSDAFNDSIPYPALILYGNNGFAAGVSAGPPSTDNMALTTYSFTLNEANFSLFTGGNSLAGPISQSQFQAILADLAGIAFRTEYRTGEDDSRFDNAVFNGFVDPNAPPAVPEPASWAMMIAGFGMIGATLRRRRLASALG